MTRRDADSVGLPLRVRTASDIDMCVRVLRDVHQQHGYPVNWPADPRAWLTAAAGSAWVALAAGDIAGHVAVSFDDDVAFVERLFVAPARSGCGIGRALLRKAVSEARLRAAEVFLDVVAAEDTANALYRAEDWVEVARSPIDWGPSPASTLIRFRAP